MRKLVATAKTIATRLGPIRQAIGWYRNRTRASFADAERLVAGKYGIEIGGPSPVFSRGGPFPVYAAAASVDNINFSDDNFWSEIKGGHNFHYDHQKPAGRQFIADAIDLSQVASATYDFVLSSHAIEHIANPIKALHEWRRVLKPDGILIIIAPDMRYTYDRLRPITAIDHIQRDFEVGMREDDATHLEEIIALHDLTNDGTVTSFAEHRERTLDNARQRIAHHHVFDIGLLEQLVAAAGFTALASDVFRPYHLLVIARAA